MAAPINEFAQHCCELLSTAGHCVARRMFGGYGISTDGLTLAILADLGTGEKLWLKAGEDSRQVFENAGCERFTYSVKGQPKSMNFYSAPEEAMDSSHAMAPWARLSLEAAIEARKSKKVAPRKSSKRASIR
ncbi:MAG: TfoX/Sxy family protein [Rhodoferax sp.]|nr:TfoX/Sxy family protein [Rhodoferax sp.]